jgi:hypothetical protein
MDSRPFTKLSELVPRFEICAFGSIREALGLVHPPFATSGSSQIDYIERHLKNHSNPPKSMLIEQHYIDRGFMDDYTTFYGSSIRPYPNWCRRIHFFSIDEKDLEPELTKLFEFAQDQSACNGDKKKARENLSALCSTFSNDSYLGFSTIRPLEGSPVGRTVLRHYEEEAPDGKRKFNCTRHYKAHLFGLELTVCGLVFQEQDQAVSACATTALWTSLSKTKDFEDIRTPTPAEITKRATQYLLTASGRAIPATEGLSLEQMCQAIQSLGLSPYVIKASASDDTKSYLFSSVLSGFAPVLLISRGASGHAVTVSGMKRSSTHTPYLVPLSPNIRFDDMSSDINDIYVNDDRYSPYFKVDVSSLEKNKKIVFVFLDDNGTEMATAKQIWDLDYILIPMHNKIRLSFAEIRQMAIDLIKRVASYRNTYAAAEPPILLRTDIQLRTKIMKQTAYLEKLFFGETKLSHAMWKKFNETVFLSRYVGVVNLTDDPTFGSLDILIDTTNIKRNPNYLALICQTKDPDFANYIVETLSRDLGDCPTIIDAMV